MTNLVQMEELFFMIAFAAYTISAIAFFVYVALKKDKVGKAAVMLTIGGFLFHNIAMVLRVMESGRLPFTNQFEFASSFTWGIVLCYIVIHFVYKFTAVGAFVMPIAFLVMGYASVLPKSIKPLMPALQSSWLYIHVGTAIISYGAFAVAAGLACMYLITVKRESEGVATQDGLPDAQACDYMSYRVIAFGFLMLTLVIITGAIWAKAAWSRYWAWDPKETWSLITWIIYAVYIHLRFNRGWKGKPAAWFAVIGFICVIFTFIGVNNILPSIHSYR
jgi:cytochrome c-type biogenesis protein CcsB